MRLVGQRVRPATVHHLHWRTGHYHGVQRGDKPTQLTPVEPLEESHLKAQCCIASPSPFYQPLLCLPRGRRRTPGEPIESGKWKLYKFEQAIGQESYEIRLIGACFAGTSAMC